MSSPNFQFKQFTIQQERCAFKVGTDSVLLGSWVNPESTHHILDIGTGSGILALMMAQKSNALVMGIDIDEDAFHQASENANASKWRERIQIQHTSIQDFLASSLQPLKFELIISNPPYFNSKAHATGTSKSIARNTEQLPFKELVKASLQLLSDEGKLCVVLPTPEAKLFRSIAENAGLVLSKLLRVQTKASENFEKRHLLQFEKTAFHYLEEILIIEENGHLNYTHQYRELTKDFYLAF